MTKARPSTSKPSAKRPAAGSAPSRASSPGKTQRARGSAKPSPAPSSTPEGTAAPSSPASSKPSRARAAPVLPREVGKPLTREEIEAVERMAGNGLTLSMIASCLGLAVETLRTRAGGDAELAKALERGKANAANAVGGALYRQATEGNVQAIRWYEATRRGLSEKVSVSHEGDLTVTVGVMSPEERRRLIAKYLGKVEKLRASPHTEKPPREITEADE